MRLLAGYIGLIVIFGHMPVYKATHVGYKVVMRQPKIRLNLLFSFSVFQELLYLLPILYLGNLSAKFSVSAFG